MKEKERGFLAKIKGILNRLLVWSAQMIEEDSEAIWSIPKPFKRAYSVAMATVCTPLIITIVTGQIEATPSNGWWNNIFHVTSESAKEFTPVGIGVAIALLVTAHIGAVIVSLYHAMANRWVKPVVEQNIEKGIIIGEERGIVIGEERGIAKALDWARRKAEAEAQGLDFNEPPPSAK